MFRLIEAKGYRCLKDVSQRLNRFEILVGVNASGKSTFFDVVGFLSDLVKSGLFAAAQQRAPTFEDLVFGRKGVAFRSSVELAIPPEERPWTSAKSDATAIFYALNVRLNSESGKLEVADETVALIGPGSEHGPLPVIVRSGERTHYYMEAGTEEFVRVRLRNQSGLKTIPSDEAFPAVAWLRIDATAAGQSALCENPLCQRRPDPLLGAL